MGASRSTHGFTIMEMLIATGIMMTVTGAVFTLMNPTQGTYKAQPEVSDMQQRMRVGAVAPRPPRLLTAGAARCRLSHNQSSCGAGSRCLLPSFARCSW